ncbi:MAG TPA: hypothetical protein VIW78_02995 [Burkholderiales bacterium]
MTDNWIDFALNVIAGATAFLCLFDGTRRLGTYGLQGKAVLMTLVAAGICVLYGSLAYSKYQDLRSRLIASQSQPAPGPLPANLGRASSPERKEALSLARARHAFVESGKLGSYVDRSGGSKAFVPNQEDLVRREGVVTYHVQLESVARSSLGEALLWLITGLVAAIFGFVVSFEKMRPSNGPSEEQQERSGEARSAP